jgi:ubiquitin-conjugating enzyme E2 D/E
MIRAPALAVASQMQTSGPHCSRPPRAGGEEAFCHPAEKKYQTLVKPLLKLSISAKRIQKELAEITLAPPPNCSAGPKGENICKWRYTILSLPGSVYEGAVLFLDITISSDYPFKPPKVTFCTRIYHYNINSQGVICLNILKDNWSPALSISKVFLFVPFWQIAILRILWLEASPLSI